MSRAEEGNQRKCIARCLSIFGCLAAMVIWLIGSASAQSPLPLPEYQVKAAFLINFAKFVEWPEQAFSSPTAPMRLCTVGKSPLGSDLSQMVEGKTIAGHPVEVVIVGRWQESRNCHIAFIGSSLKSKTKQIVEGLHGTSVLTVGETKGFADQGGIINFFSEDDRIRFEVNLQSADRASLKMSSKLLRLARIVQGPPEARGYR